MARADWRTVVPGSALFLGVGFSGAACVFVGFYPARKGAALNPIEALAASDLREPAPELPRSHRPESPQGKGRQA